MVLNGFSGDGGTIKEVPSGPQYKVLDRGNVSDVPSMGVSALSECKIGPRDATNLYKVASQAPSSDGPASARW
jgi:hypothetical protein